MKNTILFIVGAVVSGLIIQSAIDAVNVSNRTKLEPSEEVVNTLPVSTDQSLEDLYRSNFISVCDENGTQTPYCTCTLEYVVANYTWDQRMELDRMYLEDGQIPQAILDASSACIDLYSI